MSEIKQSGEQLSEADIFRIERDLGCALPHEYRVFLLKHNGGRPIPDGFTFQRSSGGELVENAMHFFYGLGSTASHADLLSVWQSFKGRIPEELFPIGEDHFGNQICLSLCGDRVGEVFFWDHERENVTTTYTNVVLLAHTFSEFLANLHERQRDWESPIDAVIRNDDVAALEKLLTARSDLEATDQWGRTMLENAAIANAVHVFEWLYFRGAQLKNSLKLAEDNVKFFPEHARIVQLIRQLSTEH